jgi:hypothetical protein
MDDAVELEVLADRRVVGSVIAASRLSMRMGSRSHWVLALSRQVDGAHYLWWVPIQRTWPKLKLDAPRHWRGPLDAHLVIHTAEVTGVFRSSSNRYRIEITRPLAQELLLGVLHGPEAERFIGQLVSVALAPV